MNIVFPAQTPVYLGDRRALAFQALVDGEPIECTISAEALEDHFGAESSREDDLQHAFENNRAVIEGAAEQLLTSVGCRPVVLRSGYFRCSGGGTSAGMRVRSQNKEPIHKEPNDARHALRRNRSAAAGSDSR
ncbi:periplasmic protein [Caballeronia temeraria]|uniref:Periplasmic protein n=1 Tax=Caballeronia temeraria TaxID=1777137 RepID=A0A158AR70_9BURK|nr:periplasmic protein [Caballeronia temeraria]